MKPLTPEEFTAQIGDLIETTNKDEVSSHISTDFAMENLLISLGYEDAVEIIRNTHRWYE